MIGLEEVLEIHKLIIEKSGGRAGVRDSGLLESALNRPFQMFDNKLLYNTILEQSGSLLEGIVKNHPSVDGNKRVGYVIFNSFLILNGYDINASEDEKYDFIINVANGNYDLKKITNWIGNHIVELK